MHAERFFEFLIDQGIEITQGQAESILVFKRELELNARLHRFISHSDVDRIIENHLSASFYFVKQFQAYSSERLKYADFGTGAGLPGFVVTIMFPQWDCRLIDSNKKKINFLKRVAALTPKKLSNGFLDCRIEALGSETGYNLISARALTSLENLASMAQRYLLPGGELHTLKGAESYKEEASQETIKNIAITPVDKEWSDEFPKLKDKVYIRIFRK